MKSILKITLWLITCFIGFQAKAQIGQKNAYIIDGKIKGINSGKIYHLGYDSKPIDSAEILNGKFTISGNSGAQERKPFIIIPGNWAFQAFIDAPRSTLEIDTTGAQHQLSDGKDYPIIWQINQTGSPMADVYERYLKETGLIEFFVLTKNMRLVKKDSATKIIKQIDSLRKVLPQNIKHWTENFISQNPASVGGIYVFTDFYHEVGERSVSYLAPKLAQFTGPAKASLYYQRLSTELSKLEQLQAGKRAPDFTLLKRDKQSLKLSSTRGSLVLLDFWASWCKPCRANIPDMKRLYAKYHAKGLEVIGISGDEKWGNWTKALDIEKMPWPQVIDKNYKIDSKDRASELYNVQAFPYYVLIDQKGEIILTSDNEKLIADKVENILK